MTQRGQFRAVPASSGGGALCFLRTTQATFVDKSANATIKPNPQEINTGSLKRISPMLNTLTVKTDVGDIEVRENELASITDEKLEQMGMSLANLRWCFTAVKWLANIGRRAVAYRKPDGGLWVQGVKLD